MTLSPTLLQHRIATLRREVAGRVIEPGDPDYDAARTVLYGAIDRHPAAIIKVANADDVRAVVTAARDTGTELAIRSGGHSSKGDSTTEGGLVLDLRDLRGLDFDLEAKTVWAEPGLTAAEVTGAAAEHGLAIGFGDTGSVGIGGITLGGGIGFLARKHGLTVDSLLAADIVTADGQMLRADPATNADLFWAIRGGGGNFGVAVRFQYRLHDLPGIVGGVLVLPATPEIVQRFVELSQAAPDALTTIGNVMNCPPMPFIDAAWHGKVVILGLLCFARGAGVDAAASVAAGQAALQPFRDLAKLGGLDAPIADLMAASPYSAMYGPEDPDYHPTAVSFNLFLDQVDRSTAEKIMERLDGSDATLRAVQLRVHGGAIARVSPDATAFAHRHQPIMVNIAVFYEGEDDKVRRAAWAEDFMRAIRGSDQGAYVNFLGDEGEARVHDAYPSGTYLRLAEVKRRYDPTNMFHLNQNIPPA